MPPRGKGRGRSGGGYKYKPTKGVEREMKRLGRVLGTNRRATKGRGKKRKGAGPTKP